MKPIAARSALVIAFTLPVFSPPHPTSAATARWTSMALPVSLGRDDASIELFPSLVVEVPAGLYLDPRAVSSNATRLLGTGSLGRIHFLAGVTNSDEIRLGAGAQVGSSLAWGFQAWTTQSHVEAGRVFFGSGELVSSRTQAVRGGGLGFRIGRPDKVHADCASTLYAHRNERSLSLNRAGRADSILARTEPAADPSWSTSVMLSIPASKGWIRASLAGGNDLRQERVLIWQYDPAQPAHLAGTQKSFAGGDLAWMGTAGRIDLLTCGLSVRQSKIGGGADPTSGYWWAEDVRSVEATLFLGAEVWLDRWIAISAGGSRSYSEVRESSRGKTDWFLRTERREGTSTVTGAGLRFRKFSADLELETHLFLLDSFRRISVSYSM